MTDYRSRRPQQGRRGFGAKRGAGRRRGPRKENIHPSRFVKAASPTAQEAYVARHTFGDFRMVPALKKNIARRGFRTPSPIQDRAIPVGLTGKDLIGIADTGTGKTVAFALPVLNALITTPRSRALIMAPTRELAQQILDEVKTLLPGTRLRTALLIGGASMGQQLRALAQKPHIVIGTPGRIKDHMERKSFTPATYNLVVLDEVDRMLDMGFVADMRRILGRMAPRRQSLFFSATMNPKVRALIEDFARAPEMISVKTGATSDNVEQDIVQHTTVHDKMTKLHAILRDNADGKFIIFDATKRGAERLSKALRARGFRADAIHGDKSQNQRRRALDRFKKNHTNVLVATDVAARGIDVPDVTHVINYALPQSYADYTHRIGRAGRAGRTGTALTFIARDGEQEEHGGRARAPRRQRRSCAQHKRTTRRRSGAQ